MLAFNLANETVHVGKTESKSLAKRRQQKIIIEFVHDEFRDFQYCETDGDWFRQHDFCRMILHECQIIGAGFKNGMHKFGWVDNQPTLTHLLKFSTVLP